MKLYTEEEATAIIKRLTEFLDSTPGIRGEDLLYFMAIGIPIAGTGEEGEVINYKTAHFLTTTESTATLVSNGFILLAPKLIPVLYTRLTALFCNIFSASVNALLSEPNQPVN